MNLHSMPLIHLPVAAAICALLLPAAPAPAESFPENWPQYRGAASDGLAGGATLPSSWSETENVVWRTEVPGWGWSSPVVWGERIFLTSVLSEEEMDVPHVGGYPGGNVHPEDDESADPSAEWLLSSSVGP